MATRPMTELISKLRRCVRLPEQAEATDGQLLHDYCVHRDGAALAVLIQRHSAMVWGVCRRVLANHHDAEDAFQSTFLVLVRKAASIASPELVANWLYGVARQTALKARAAAARRCSREKQVTEMPEIAAEHGLWDDLQPLLDQELSRLPDRYRVAIILCDLEGMTRKEAARQLGVPDGTLAAWVARGRVMLAKRLAKHGLAVSGGLLATLLARNAEAAAPVPVMMSAIQAAATDGSAITNGFVPDRVLTLTEGVVKAMLFTKLKVLAMVLTLGALAAWGGGFLMPHSAAHAGPARRGLLPNPTDSIFLPVQRDVKKAPGWREAFTVKQDHPVSLVVCSADWIAAGDNEGNVFLYDLKSGKNRRHLFKGDQDPIPSVDYLQFTPDGSHLFVVANNRRLLFRFDLNDPNGPHPGIGGDGATYRGFAADGEWWLENSSSNKVLMIRPNGWTNNATGYESIRYDAEIVEAVLSANDQRLAVITADERLHIHDRKSLKEIQTIILPRGRMHDVRFSEDSKRLAVVGDNGFARVYDPETGKEVVTLKGHEGIVHCVAFSPDGKRIVTGGDDHKARIWDAATGEMQSILKGHADSVRSVAFSPGGETLLTGSSDKTVKAWRVK